MTSTSRFQLPLLQPAQAQKHVTVNEALTLLDSFMQLHIQSLSKQHPPSFQNTRDGDIYAVPAGASNEWTNQSGKLALFSNGGWVFITPQDGWRGWVADKSNHYTYYSGTWARDTLSAAPPGNGVKIQTFDHTIVGSGDTSTTTTTIPEGHLVFAITGRVLQTINGTSKWKLGIADDAARYGRDLNNHSNETFAAISLPVVYDTNMPLVLTAENGTLSGGKVRFSVHYLTFAIPVAD